MDGRKGTKQPAPPTDDQLKRGNTLTVVQRAHRSAIAREQMIDRATAVPTANTNVVVDP
jgi:hypothetical protein